MKTILQEHPYSQVETLCLSQCCELEVRRWKKDGKVECNIIIALEPYSDEAISVDKETASAIIALLSKFVEEKQ